jgi:fluoroquinolone transport system permease protein
MIFRVILNSFKTDIKFIVRDPMLLFASLAPFILILVLRLVFPPLADFIYLKTGFLLERYYSVTAITFISIIPMLFGMVYAFILLDENDQHILQVISVTPAGKKNFLFMRMIVPAVFSFILIGVSIMLTRPVTEEGWLRTLFVIFLMSLQSPFVFLFIGSLAGNKIEGLALSKFYGVFLIAVPLGLLLHHPWSYLAFFSPLYWIAWAWVVPVPVEAIIYGAISLILTFGAMIFLFRHFLKKQSG